jgi:hypothetical protein
MRRANLFSRQSSPTSFAMTAGKIPATWRQVLASDPEAMTQECGFTDGGSRAASKLLWQAVVEGTSRGGPWTSSARESLWVYARSAKVPL